MKPSIEALHSKNDGKPAMIEMNPFLSHPAVIYMLHTVLDTNDEGDEGQMKSQKRFKRLKKTQKDSKDSMDPVKDAPSGYERVAASGRPWRTNRQISRDEE